MHQHRLSLEDAEQLAQEAICRIFAVDYARYEPDTHGDVLRFLGSILNGLVANQRRHEAYGTSWLVASDVLVESHSSPEEHAMLAEHGRLALAKLRRRAKRDVLVMRLVEAILFDGIHGPAEQAKHLGVRVEAIYEAWRRLREHLEAISNSMGDK
jgi:DNA-directed RNA polymerase specialized sigma24 family protein